MNQILLSPEIVVDLCCPHSPFRSETEKAVQIAQTTGRVWVYTGAVGSMIRAATQALEGDAEKAAAALAEVTGKFQWLAALAGDGAVFDQPDPEIGQLSRACQRLGSAARLMTRNDSLLSELQQAITPAQFIRLPATAASFEFIDLMSQQDYLRPELERRIHTVLHHGRYIMGPEIEELEQELARYVGVPHCISVSSGTDALLIAMMALGIGVGDEVITVPYTWISTAEAIALLGARTVFVDIDPHTFTMDVSLIEEAITPRTKAIMPVSLYGQCADMQTINELALRHNLTVIEDAAQSFGATFQGRRSCGLSTIGCTSFFPSKPLGCYGDGGALFTTEDELAERMRQIRVHGQKQKHIHPIVGVNGRFDALQAAVLLAKFPHFENECVRRQQAANTYAHLLQDQLGDRLEDLIRLPQIADGNTSVYAQYTVLLKDRERVQAALSQAGVPSVAYYVAPLHLQGAFTSLGHQPGDFPIAEEIAQKGLSLPMSPTITRDQQELVAHVMAQCLKAGDISAAVPVE